MNEFLQQKNSLGGVSIMKAEQDTNTIVTKEIQKMKDIITINGTEIQVKEYKGKRVVTFSEIDTVHGRPDGTARKRFNDNKERFVEGEDFFKVTPDEFYGVIERPQNGQSIFEVVDSLECARGIDYHGYIFLTEEPETGLIKVGRTRHQVRKRMTGLNAGRTNVLSIYGEYECKDVLKAQKEICRQMEHHQKKGEWFSMPLEEAETIVKAVVAKVDKEFDPNARHKGGARVPITLLTESGYLMLVKSFTDDLAWTVQRQLVNTYFRATPDERRQAAEDTMRVLPKDYASALRALADKVEENQKLNETVEQQKQAIADFQPIKQYVDTILSSTRATTTTQVAADYDLTAIRLNRILHDEGVQRKVGGQWILYEKHMGKGYTKSRTIPITRSDGSDDSIVQTEWSQKGRLFIHELLTRRGIKANMDKARQDPLETIGSLPGA